MNNNLNMLFIDAQDNTPSASRTRLLDYAKLASNYYLIERRIGKAELKEEKSSPNLFIIPVRSWSRLSFIYRGYKAACRILREKNINCIATKDPFTLGLVGYLLKKKFKIGLNVYIGADIINNKSFIKERPYNWFLNSLGKWIVRRADTVRVTTSQEKEKLKGMNIDEHRIFYVPLFLDFEPFLKNDDSGLDIRRKYLNGRFDKLILTVCRLAKQKDLQTLLKTISLVRKAYPTALFLIIGSGQEEKNIKSSIAQLGIKDQVRLIEKVDYSYIPKYFSACDLFVISSLYEGTCVVILEAMAANKPVISTPHTGAQDAIVDGKTGFIINFCDSEQLAQKVIYLLKNPELAREMGEKGQRYLLESFNKEKILKNCLKMWRQTVNYRNEAPRAEARGFLLNEILERPKNRALKSAVFRPRKYKTLGTIQKKKLCLTLFLKRLDILSYAKKIRRIYLSFVLRKRYIKFYTKPNTRKLENQPLFYTFEPTLQCNLSCDFCYEKDLKKEKNKEMSLEQIRQALNTLKLDDKVINLTGGEIFIREDIFEILEYFKERNVFSYIVTNGTFFEKSIVHNLPKYNIRGIEFSLDGPEKVHNQIRNSKDTFERLIKAIELTKDRFRISINCVIQERNIDSLTEVVFIAHNLKIKELNFQLEIFTTPEILEDTKQILGWDNLTVSLQVKPNPGYNSSGEILEKKWDEVKKIAKRLGMDINIYPSLFNKYIGACAQRRLRNTNLRLMCTELLTGRIDPYGNVIPCYIIRKSFGNLLASSFEQIWNFPDFREFRYKMARNNLLPICENCCKLGLI